MTKIAGFGCISQRHGSVDPDPYQNVMDPQHCGFAVFLPRSLIDGFLKMLGASFN